MVNLFITSKIILVYDQNVNYTSLHFVQINFRKYHLIFSYDFYIRDAWNRLGNMDQNCAKLKYIELVREVDPKWDAELTPFVVNHLLCGLQFSKQLFASN